jgi:uncharacterized protein (DUF4415 family)
MKALKLKLAIAKEEHAALRPTVQLPDTKAYTRAVAFITNRGATFNEDGYNPERRQHLAIIARNDLVMAYRAEKKRLSDAVNAIRLEMLAVAEIQQRIPQASKPSDLE